MMPPEARRQLINIKESPSNQRASQAGLGACAVAFRLAAQIRAAATWGRLQYEGIAPFIFPDSGAVSVIPKRLRTASPYQKKLICVRLQIAAICSMLITHYHKITL